jgi:hypothetical protein
MPHFQAVPLYSRYFPITFIPQQLSLPMIELVFILTFWKHLNSAVQDPHRARTDFSTYPKTINSPKGGQPIRSSYIAASSLSPYRQELQRTMSSHYNSVRREESELQMLSQQVATTLMSFSLCSVIMQNDSDFTVKKYTSPTLPLSKTFLLHILSLNSTKTWATSTISATSDTKGPWVILPV